MILELVSVLALGLAWEGWSRYLKHKERVTSLRNDRQDMLLKELGHLRELMTRTSDDIGVSIEKNRAILKGFIDSMTDLVKISEEDKQNLQNRLVAARLGKK